MPQAWHAPMTTGMRAEPARPDALPAWWRQLEDPDLSALIDKVLAANTDLRSARARLLEARARRGAADAALFPALGASAAGRRSGADNAVQSSASLYTAGFDASWEIDIFGGIRRGAQAAQADVDASAASLDAIRVSLAAEAALDYVEARTLQARSAIARSSLASQTETWQLSEWRTQAGLASSLDAEQARANLEQTRAQLPKLDESLAQAWNRLAVLAGEAPGSVDRRLAQPGAIPAPPAQIAIGIPADLLRRRPDVRAAELRLAAESYRLGAAQAARYPRLSLAGTIGLEALSPGALARGTVTHAAGATLAATLFDGGRLRHQAEAQDALRQQAAIAYEAAVLAALADVENALVSFARSGERKAALRAAQEAARNAAALARARYAGGLIDFQTVLDTERSMLSIDDSLAVAQSESVSALIRLYKALGGGWPSAAAATH